jgi:BirA family biotin operon repressor/biotin-[acetyl-CoA-carboxylase] ligase
VPDLSEELLEEATRAWAPAARFLEVCDSTNRIAWDWAEEEAPEGCLVVADQQTAGRGRVGRSWFSVPGGSLLVSVVLRPQLPGEYLGLVGLAAGVAVARALEQAGVVARLKWPNDVVVGGRKVAGVLAEARSGPGGFVILGVGINVAMPAEQIPPELRNEATSLAAEGAQVNRLDLLVAFLGHFGGLYVGAGTRRPEAVLEEYRPLCDTLGRRVRVVVGDAELRGVAVDLTPHGALVLDTGEIVWGGDVSLVRPEEP